MHLGYCTNVHAGADFASSRANLQEHALAVKERFSPTAPMGIGLWLSQSAADGLVESGGVEDFRDWLADAGLVPFTLNGFPQGDFHQQVVKHRVYQPTWLEHSRLDYTRRLADILDAILPPGVEGSISTLPIAWGDPPLSREQEQQAAAHLREAARHLAEIEQTRQRLIYLCLEPEPGCVLQQSGDVVRFFENRLLKGADESLVRRHLRVCHDVCHAAVMFEEQGEVLRRYADAGIAVGKVQVSSAIDVPFHAMASDERQAAFQQLRQFAEDRYLHQTVCRPNGSGAQEWFYEDLPLALEHARDAPSLTGTWRIHFHVPIYLKEFGRLRATQSAILDCLSALDCCPDLTHFEVETYAWPVLPDELKQPSLAAGIAKEMEWFRGKASSLLSDVARQRNG